MIALIHIELPAAGASAFIVQRSAAELAGQAGPSCARMPWAACSPQIEDIYLGAAVDVVQVSPPGALSVVRPPPQRPHPLVPSAHSLSKLLRLRSCSATLVAQGSGHSPVTASTSGIQQEEMQVRLRKRGPPPAGAFTRKSSRCVAAISGFMPVSLRDGAPCTMWVCGQFWRLHVKHLHRAGGRSGQVLAMGAPQLHITRLPAP